MVFYKKRERREEKENFLYLQLNFEVILSFSPIEADMSLENMGKLVPLWLNVP